MATGTATQAPPVKSAMRTLDLIEFVVARPAGVAAQEVASALAIPVSSLSYLLATLVERGYLRRQGRQYFTGEGLARLSIPPGERALVDRARPLIKALRHRLNETATLFTLADRWQIEAVFSETTAHPLRYAIEVGTLAPMHSVSAGKAILAAMPSPMLDHYFDEAERAQFTAATIIDDERLREEIELTRERGFGVARDEFTMGITAIGIALPLGDGEYSAISVAAPSLRVTDAIEQEIVEQLRSTARALEPGG